MGTARDITDLKLAGLLCNRICDEIVGPVGAISNGVEMLDDEDCKGQEEKVRGLMSLSARQLVARARFYRMAFGYGFGKAWVPSVQEAREAALDMFEDSNINLEWPEPEHDSELSMPGVQLILGVILLASDTLAGGGELKVSLRQNNGTCDCSIVAGGRSTNLDDGVKQILGGLREPDTANTGRILAFYAQALAKALEGAVDVYQPRDDRMQFVTRYPMKSIQEIDDLTGH